MFSYLKDLYILIFDNLSLIDISCLVFISLNLFRFFKFLICRFGGSK